MTEERWWVWINNKPYKLYSDGNTVRYEGNGKFIVKQGTKEQLQKKQQAS